ncbi:DUF6602 domain-containing protein [Aequorivita antarctica]|uniref:DUF6602 domain-containing protein n=1 Tax=Aequorivita antarctica TaxID=153266 RepID=A0A5C6YY35_9FLAO|nr:DUF6602 domain-containing protein [Aequorivita antarctica]TXD72556.1 hypothetical protein ESU54_12135 [Aequorivita antarctica]SRX75347.1 hypothetical protein AEQU3_02341 [Aequorivita antarctica]
MLKELKFDQIVENIIGEINEAKRKAKSIHSAGNIKSSGEEVEDLVREKISIFLPERYLVKQGHIINSKGKVSNQFDIIIFDRLSTPKFFESKDNTVFYPIESVLAVGEIKKTLRKNDLIDFGKKIKFLKKDMERTLVPNTAFDGTVTGDTLISDMINIPKHRKYNNSLFSFIFAIDIEKPDELNIDDEYKFMPNDVYILNFGMYLAGKIENKRIVSQLEDEVDEIEGLIVAKKPGVVCMATMLNQLIAHLNESHIDPFSISRYMTDKNIFGILGAEIKVYDVRNK